MNIRPTNSGDIPALKAVLDSTELFPSDMLSDMLSGFLSDQGSDDIWFTCEIDNQAIGFCFAMPEALTDGTWNMLAIAVLPSKQAGGAGSAMVAHLEATLKDRGQRVLIADTSGADAFARTRAFYRKNGYTQEARIRDYWAAGDDKIIFWKSLEGNST